MVAFVDLIFPPTTPIVTERSLSQTIVSKPLRVPHAFGSAKVCAQIGADLRGSGAGRVEHRDSFPVARSVITRHGVGSDPVMSADIPTCSEGERGLQSPKMHSSCQGSRWYARTDGGDA